MRIPKRRLAFYILLGFVLLYIFLFCYNFYQQKGLPINNEPQSLQPSTNSRGLKQQSELTTTAAPVIISNAALNNKSEPLTTTTEPPTTPHPSTTTVSPTAAPSTTPPTTTSEPPTTTTSATTATVPPTTPPTATTNLSTSNNTTPTTNATEVPTTTTSAPTKFFRSRHTADDEIVISDPDSAAIIGYLPNQKKFEDEANRYLHSSWAYSIANPPANARRKTDLILFANPEVLPKLPASCIRVHNISDYKPDTTRPSECIVVAHVFRNEKYWSNYTFMYSLSFLSDPRYERLYLSYGRLLRTDLDCFVTPEFMNWRPSKFVVGRGGYIGGDFTRQRLIDIATKIGYRHRKSHNLGSTWFGDPQIMIDLVKIVERSGKHILENEFGPDVENVWPKWWKGVTSMYAQEIAINDRLEDDQVEINFDSVDVNSNSNRLRAEAYHIHVWPGVPKGDYFDKYQQYKIEDYPRDKLNITIIKDYCMAMFMYGK